jgi:hypothetical protein
LQFQLCSGRQFRVARCCEPIQITLSVYKPVPITPRNTGATWQFIFRSRQLLAAFGCALMRYGVPPPHDPDRLQRAWLSRRESSSATSGRPTMFARIGVMRAFNRHVKRVFNPDRKDHHWGRRKLARETDDQHEKSHSGNAVRHLFDCGTYFLTPQQSEGLLS